MNIKNSVLEYIKYKQLAGMAKCKEWMKKGHLEKFWNVVHLEEEVNEDSAQDRLLESPCDC